MDYSTNWKKLISIFGYGFVDDLEQYKFIVKVRAYTDMQPRTIRGLGEFRKDSDNNDKLSEIFDNLAESLHSFVVSEPAKSETEFNKWHKTLCEKFVGDFNRITDKKNVEKIKFGKAQKIINVSLKYIYCLKGADQYADKFKHCHMILDRYTYSEGFYKKEVMPYCNISAQLTSWSKLTYDEYNNIQKNISDFLKESNQYKNSHGKSLTPFEAEFYIFNKYNQ